MLLWELRYYQQEHRLHRRGKVISKHRLRSWRKRIYLLLEALLALLTFLKFLHSLEENSRNLTKIKEEQVWNFKARFWSQCSQVLLGSCCIEDILYICFRSVNEVVRSLLHRRPKPSQCSSLLLIQWVHRLWCVCSAGACCVGRGRSYLPRECSPLAS